MKIAWVMGGAGDRLVVDFTPLTTTVGTIVLKDYPGPIACIRLGYALEHLTAALPALNEMRRLELVPRVHIWNRTKKDPELRVEYRIPCAGRDLLSRFAGDLHNTIERVDALSFTAELCIGSAGNGTNGSVETFFRVFKKRGFAAILVDEDTDPEDRSRIYRPEPYGPRFVVTTIGTKEPLPLEFE